MFHSIKKGSLSVLLALLLSLQALAQTSTTTSVSGLVTDLQSAVIPGATVKLKEITTNQERTEVTNAEGRYIFSNLDPGTYNLTVSADKFKTLVIRDIKAEVTKPVTQDVKLEVGGVIEEVS